MSELPEPLTPPDADLRDFQFMPVDVVRLRDSGIAVEATGEEFRAALLLWCAAWHQVPAGSLPDNDTQLSMLAGYGRVVKEWLKVKAGAMRGFIACADGRLYHPVVAEKVNEAWRQKCAYAEKREADRQRKEAARLADKQRLSGGQDANVRQTGRGQTPENALKGQGEDLKGQGQKKERVEVARGTRLPPDWKPSDDEWNFAAEIGMGEQKIRTTADNFRDYWTAKAGQNATKLDWTATWRGWVRRECDSGQRANGKPVTRDDTARQNHLIGLDRAVAAAGGQTR